MMAGLAATAADQQAIRLAMAQARLCEGTADVPVGAVVLDDAGQVLGQGHNQREAAGDPTAHAEVVAIRAAALARGSWRLSGCSLAVSLEPCLMCAGAIVAARVSRLVFGAWDFKAGAVGSVWDVIRDWPRNRAGQDATPPGGDDSEWATLGDIPTEAAAPTELGPILGPPRIEVVAGVRASECAHLLQDFFAQRR